MKPASGSMRWRVRLSYGFVYAMGCYWFAVFPQVRREVKRWRERAVGIPDAVLRCHALQKLEGERLTADGAAAFAVMVRRSHRAAVVRFCVAFEVMFDYLDALGERPHPRMLRNNRCLNGALVAATQVFCAFRDPYGENDRHADGGYVRELVATCRRALIALPSHTVIEQRLERAAVRAAEAQSLNHGGIDARSAFRAWAETMRMPDQDVHWWEIAAGAGSPLGIYALVTAAAGEATSEHHAALVEDAYFPWIAALSWLIESVVDYADDRVTGNPSYVSHYASQREATERLRSIARHAMADARRLPQAELHVLLLAGMVALNLSHHGADDAAAREACEAVREALGGVVTPLLLVLRLRRWLGSLRGGGR